MASIRAGIGGWTYAPWRDNFYPRGLKQAEELSYASQHVPMIEINGTFYRMQSPESFRRWADETPEGFMFSVKAHRLTTHRKILADCGPSIDRFIESGLAGLGKKLGPILWQFAPTKKFEPDDFEAFLAALPRKIGSLKLLHAVEVRHESFRNAGFVALARRYKAAICLALSDRYPLIADVTSDFIYVRLQTSQPDEATGYSKQDLDRWAGYAKSWAEGRTVETLPLLDPANIGKPKARDSYIVFIAGAKERNPAAAMAFMKRIA